MDLMIGILKKVFGPLLILIGSYFLTARCYVYLLKREAREVKQMELGVIEKLNTNYKIACRIWLGKQTYLSSLAGRKSLDLQLLFDYAEKAKPALGADYRGYVDALKSAHISFLNKKSALESSLRSQDYRIDPALFLNLIDSSMAIWYQLSKIAGDEFQFTSHRNFKSASDFNASLRKYFNVDPNFENNLED